MRIVERNSELASLGGVSQIRDRQDRQENLGIDQLVGQIGQYAGSRWLTGSSEQYRVSRWVANRNPELGDGGSDILASNIDFKASLVRNTSKSLLTYNLPVRQRERHTDWLYVLVLVTDVVPQKSAQAHLIGWATTDMLPEKPDDGGVFRGAYTIQAMNLNPLPPFRWMA